MRSNIITLVLALSVISWAQTATQTSPSTPQQSTTSTEKAKCPCCEKMSSSDMKEMHACCAHHGSIAADDKEMASRHKDMASCCADKKGASCCAGKDGASCMKDKDAAAKACCGDKCGKDKTAASCCGDACSAEKCTKEGKGCCSSEQKSAKNCCAHPNRA